MDNTREDKPTTNAAAEEILSDKELDSIAGGGGTGCGRATFLPVDDSGSYRFVRRLKLSGGGTGRG